jgi:hypothetical protein
MQLVEQERVWDCEPQLVQATLRVPVVLAWHSPCPPQLPTFVHAPQAQLDEHVRVWGCMPQFPQGMLRVSVAVG